MKRQMLSLVLCLCLLLGLTPVVLAAETDAWDGTVDTSWYDATAVEFTLTTPAQLAGFSAITNGTIEGITADTFSGKTVKLGADIDLGGEEWTPIGGQSTTSGTPFKGTFDGQGKVIKNLKVTSNLQYSGLFSIVSTAIIQNLTVDGVNITYNATNYCYAGAVVAYAMSTSDTNVTITNCGVMNGNINVVANGNIYAGGVVGYVTGNNNSGKNVTYCYNNNVVVTASKNTYAGGVVGRASDTGVASCYAYVPSQKDAPLNVVGWGNASNNVRLAATEDSASVSSFAGRKQTEAQFASGAVTGYLNEYTGGSLKWGQELGVDAVPSIGGMPMERIQIASDNTYAYVNAELTVDEDGTYIINNAAEWVAFANNVKYHNYSNAHLSAKVMPENAIIDFSTIPGWENGIPATSAEYLTIGKYVNTSQYPYSGTFDGNGCTVVGLKFATALTSHFALFSNVNGGTIKNITVDEISIKTSRGAAAIVYYLNDGTVENCHVKSGSIEGTNTSYAVSGLVVQAKGATIKNCSNGADITSAVSSGTGGILAYVVNNYTVTIENCINTGDITSTSYNVGGIAGKLLTGCTVEECYNTGKITGTSSVGGLVGYFSVTAGKTAEIKNSYNLGAVTGGDTVYTIGGILGNGTPTLTNCYNVGTVTGKTCAQPLIGKTYSDTAFDVKKVINTYALHGCAVTGHDENYVYYGSDGSNRLTTGKTLEDFNGGAIAYLLQNGTGGSVWGQDIGIDDYPVLNSTSKVVKITFAMVDGENGTAPAAAYTNAGSILENYPVHETLGKGYKFYSDEAGTNEINQTEYSYATDSTVYVEEIDVEVYMLQQQGTAAFADLIYGYTNGSSAIFTFKNIGNKDISGISASVTGDAFAITEGPSASVKVGETVTVTVASKSGLSVKDLPYEGILKLTWDNGPAGGLSVALKQNVNKASASCTVSLDNWTYGDTENAPTSSYTGDPNEPTAIYTYQASGSEDFSETVPTNAGTHTVKVSYPATENFNATENTATFTISPKSIADAAVVLNLPAGGYTYDGTEKKPNITSVTLNDATVLDATDYTVSYSNNQNAGEANVTVTGSGNYTGTISTTFSIGQATLTIIGDGTVAVSKAYDTTNSAGTLTGELSFSGKVEGDNVQIVATPGSYAENAIDVGDNKTVTLTLELAGDAKGNYKLATETYTFSSASIVKGTYVSNIQHNVIIRNGAVRTGEVTLSDLFGSNSIPAEAQITTVTASSTSSAVMASVTPSEGKISYSSSNNAADTTATDSYLANISSKNYNDFNVTLVFQATNKESVVITGTTAIPTGEKLEYDGTSKTGYVGNAECDNVPNLEISYTGTTADGAAYSGNDAPTDAGTYLVTIQVPDTDPTYIGSIQYSFTIEPRPLSWDTSGLKAEEKKKGSDAEVKVTGTLLLNNVVGSDLTFAQPEMMTSGFDAYTESGSYTVDVVPASGNWRDTIQGNKLSNYILPGNPTVSATVKNAVIFIPVTPVEPEPPADDTCNGGEDCPTNHFTDVDQTQDYHEAIDFVYENGYMVGMSGTEFGTDTTMHRGMIMTILYAMEKDSLEAQAIANTFTDVSDDAYYAEAVNWAAQNGICSGYGNGKFGPEDEITIEQLAAFLYRFAEYKGWDITAEGDLSGLDYSSWFETQLKWAIGNEIMDAEWTPKAEAKRWQAAMMLYNFCK